MTVTLQIGQVVPWGHAPMGLAQICDLRRRNVTLCYPNSRGNIRRPSIRARDLYQIMLTQPLLLNLHNVYDRGCPNKTRKYIV